MLLLSHDNLEVWQHTLKLRLPTVFYHTELTEIRDQTIDTEWNNVEQQLDKVLCSFIGSFACFLRDICEFCGADFVYLGKHFWRCKQRVQPVNHPTVDNPMRPPDTSTSLTNDQYNGDHAHSIINEERPLNFNSVEQSLNNQNNNDDCYMKGCYCGKLCKGLRGLKAHQRSCKV